MEVIVIWFLSMVAMDTEIQKQQTVIDELTAQSIVQQIEIVEINKVLESHEATIVKTAAAHSSLYANQQLENAAFQDELEILQSQIKALEMSEGEGSAPTPNVPNSKP
jgi:two-component sensor histidine kinase